MKTKAEQYWKTRHDEIIAELRSRVPTTMDTDMAFMHERFNLSEAIEKMRTKKQLKEFLDLRVVQINEEAGEFEEAVKSGNSDDSVDALIDLAVFAIGTLDAMRVDIPAAWYEVLIANLDKEVGVKEERPNPLGLPDLVKPEGWEAPSHKGNTGLFDEAYTS